MTPEVDQDHVITLPEQGYELAAVYEFRPLPKLFRGEFRRYANGDWILDDGEYDIAFIDGPDSWGAPICLYFDPSYQRNIVGKWFDHSWAAYEPRHPNGNAWHYALREGATTWGGDWGRDKHPNKRAGDAGMSKRSSEVGCSNGRIIDPTDLKDEHVLAGLVRNRETKAVLAFPAKPVCMRCGDVYRAQS